MNKTFALLLAVFLAASGASPASAAVAAAARAASHPVILAPVGAVGAGLGHMPMSPLGLTQAPSLTLPSFSALSVAPASALSPAVAPSAAMNPAAAANPVAQAAARNTAFAAPAAVAAALPSGSAAAPSARQASALPAIPGRAAAQPSLKDGLAKTASAVGAQARGGVKAGASLNSLFDGMKALGSASFSADPEAVRPPDWNEDQRINRALKRLGESRMGLDLYRHVYQAYPNLSIKIDDDASAKYDARVAREGQAVVLYLTEKLVDRESADVVAAYLAREMSHLYFASFPESAERHYMAHGNMARVFAELTDSGLARHGYWWNTSKDQWTGDAYAMQRYYGSWKEAVSNAYNRRLSVRDSAFFQWLRQSEGKGTLRDLYYAGRIGWREYQEMSQYFDQVVLGEQSWFHDTQRW